VTWTQIYTPVGQSLVWSALGAAASPRMALYFAATQFPIYLLPRLIETLIGRDTGKAKP